jgi:VWFA-related protein
VVQDITVTDTEGHPITGLKPEDFHIFEDGRPQTIKNFEEHAPIDPTLAAERQAELAATLPPNTFTNYKALAADNVVVFLFDRTASGND